MVNHKLIKIGGEGGLISVDQKANVVLSFNSTGMYRAFKRNEEPIYARMYIYLGLISNFILGFLGGQIFVKGTFCNVIQVAFGQHMHD